MSRKRQWCLAVNRRGFASLYALAILQIITIFCVLLISSATSIAQSLRAKDSLHHAQLAAIYRIKARLKQEPSIDPTDCETNEDAEESEQPSQTTFLLDEESMQIEGYTIHLVYQEETVDVQIENLCFTLIVDPEEKRILDLVYDEEKSPS